MTNTKNKLTGMMGLMAVVVMIFSAFSLPTDDHGNDPKELIKKMEEAMGGWNALYDLKDVQFTYNYEYPGQGKKDVSTEKYIFEGEHSWAHYTTHQINVMPEQGGEVIQSYVNSKPSISHDGKMIKSNEAMGGTTFLRKANYYWFTMMYKLSDPGVQLSSMDHETMNGVEYHKVKVEFNAEKVGKEVNDTYILYINPKTDLVDQFYFSLPAAGVNDPVILMTLDYETIDGVKIPSKRLIYQPNAEGKYTDTPNLVQTTTNIKFNNGFKPEDLMIK